MSVDIYVLCTADLPAKAEWQIAVAKQQFSLKLDPVFDPAKDSGFWPARLNGEVAGFEYYPLIRNEWKGLPNLVHADRVTAGADLSTGARPVEFVSSVLAAVAVARVCGGVVYDPQEGRVYVGAAMDVLVKQAAENFGVSLPKF